MRSIVIASLILLSGGLAVAQSKIIFSRSTGALNSGETPDLMIHDLATSQTHVLLKGTVKRRGEYNAAVSPEGNRIIFNTYRFSGWKLAIADFDGQRISNVQRFTTRKNYEYNPSWSHSGREVVYQEFSWSTNDTEIFIKDMSTGSIRQLTDSEGGDRLPAWTYDDSRIVFTSGRSGNYDIFVASKTGDQFTNLTNHESHDIAPSCAPVDNRIAFLSNRSGRYDLYVLNLDNQKLKCLTSQLYSDPNAYRGWDQGGSWAYKTSWSPDGGSIVFTLPVDGNLELFVVNVDGSDLRQITNNNDADFSPHWVK